MDLLGGTNFDKTFLETIVDLIYNCIDSLGVRSII